MRENKKKIWIRSELTHVEFEEIDIITSSFVQDDDEYEGELDII